MKPITVFSFCFLFGISLLFFHPTASLAKSTPVLLTHYIAKEYCSCRFVVGQSAQVCKNENKATNLLFRLEEDSQNRVVKVTNVFTKAEARFVSDNHGCLLVK